MKYRKKRKDGGSPSFVDPEFADSLEAGGGDSFRTGKHGDHKARQLCREVQRALNLALAGDGQDEALADLYVVDVTPAPHCGNLLVHVLVPAGQPVLEALNRLHGAAPRLRAEVAMAITRKRAPELTFIPIADSGGGHE